MPPRPTPSAREKLLKAGTELFRIDGYAATSVEAICNEAGVTKGAFFHHFPSKEELARACLAQWDAQGEAMDAMALKDAPDDPVQRVRACLSFYIEIFSDPKLVKSCLAGTTVQETADSKPELREAAHACFAHAEERLTKLLQTAARPRKKKRLDCVTLARLWMATMQGSLILAKASGDDAVIASSLAHVREYIISTLANESRSA